MADTSKPTAPTAIGDLDRVTLTWKGASDNVGIVKQEVWDGNTFLRELAVTTRSYTTPRLTAGEHRLRLVVYDAAGNYANSNTVSVTVEDSVAAPAPTPAPIPTTAPPAVPKPAYRFNALVLDEQFSSPTLDLTRWGPYSGPGNHAAEPGIRSPSAIAIVDGQLVITAKNAPDGQIVTGAMAHKANYAQGRWEVRCRTENDPTASLSGVVILWPEGSMRPGDGEVDFMETTTKTTRRPSYSFVHYGGDQNLQKWFIHDIDASEWHTWGCEWTPEYLRVFCDDRQVGEVTDRAAIPTWSRGLHLCLQLDAFAKRAISPVRMFVDSVRIYQ